MCKTGTLNLMNFSFLEKELVHLQVNSVTKHSTRAVKRRFIIRHISLYGINIMKQLNI